MANIESSTGLIDSDSKQSESKNESRSIPIVSTVTSYAPKNVSQRLWEKFKLLEKRTDDISQKYREKRNKLAEKNCSSKGNEDRPTQNENEKEMKKQDIKSDGASNKNNHSAKASTSLKEQGSKSEEGQWEEVRGLIDVNKHLDPGITYSQTELEKAIDKAVELGDIETAEQLSDKLANRQFGKKISDAFKAKEYLKRKKTEEESAKQKKSKKLHWGFQEKERWETKGNM